MKKLLLFFLIFNLLNHLCVAQCTAVSITTQPTNQNDSIPGAAHFNVTVAGSSPFNYYWYVNGVVVDSTVNSASSTNTYNTPPLTMADSNNTYYCVITNCSGLNSVTSNTVNLICIPVSISIQPSSQTVQAGTPNTTSFSVTVNGTPPFTYHWYQYPSGNIVKTTIDTVGHTSIYSIPGYSISYAMNGFSYRVVISNHCNGGGGGSNQVLSYFAYLTVFCPFMGSPSLINSSWDACNGDGIGLSTNPVAGATYNWTANGFTSPSFSPYYTATAYSQGFCPSVNSFSLTLTINGCTSPASYSQTYVYSPATLNNPPPNQTICSGGTVSYTPSVNCGYFTNISHYATSCVTGFSSSGLSINDILINNGTVPCTVTYYIQAQNDGCWASTFNFTVTVNPTPNVSVNSPTICNGQTVTLTANGASIYAWSAGATSTGVNTATVSPTVTTTYTVTGTNSYGCTNTAVATVMVGNVNPNVTVNSPTICSGQTATLTANGASTYTWSAGATSTGINTASASPTVTTTYTVTGTNTCGSNTAVATVTVNPVPATPTANVTPSGSGSGYFCSGNSVALNTASVAGATYNWTGTGGFSSSLQNPSATVTSNNCTQIYTYSVTVTVGGCISALGSTTVYVHQNAVITNPPANQVICSGGTVSYVPNFTGCSPASVDYFGSAPSCITGFTSSGSGNISDVLVNTGTTPCTVTYNIHAYNWGDACSNGLFAFSVTVNPSPAISVNSPTICAGQTATLTSSGGNTYAWSAGATPSGVNTATASPTVTTTYTVTGTNGNSCHNTAISTVTVNPLPTITVNSPSICVGQTATLIANGGSTYTWSSGATPVGSDSASASPISTTTFTVTGTDSNSCSNTAISTVTVNPSSAITVNSPTICSGQTATLIANGGITYVWSAGATSTGVNTAGASPATTTTYTVTGTNACGMDSTTATVTVVPTIIPSVSIALTSGTNPECPGGTATFTATPVNGGTLPVYQWYINGNNAGTNSDTFTTTSLSNNDIITCQMTSNEVCASPAVVVSDSITMNLYPTYTSTENQTICTGQTYSWHGIHYSTSGTYIANYTTINGCDSIFTLNLLVNNNINTTVATVGDTLTSNQNGATYQWLDCEIGNLPIAGATSQSYVVTSNGQYAVAVNLGGCADTSACVFFYSIGVNQLTSDTDELEIYPNPTTGEFQIIDYKFQIQQLRITDVLGNVILQSKINNKQATINISGFAKGIYFIEVATDSLIIRKKIVLQ